MQKIALITGPTSGIGRFTALELARKGYDLILVARNEAKARALQSEIGNTVSSSFIHCDLSSIASVRRAVEEIKAGYQHIDLLINNAGLIVQHRQTSVDGIELTFATNHLGPFVLTTGLIDLLKAAESARVINLASEAHYFAFRYRTAKLANPPHYYDLVIYGRSKLANILFSNELSERLAPFRITSNAMHPGMVSSSFAGDSTGLTARFMKYFRPFLRTPEKAAAGVVQVATAPELGGITGLYFVNSKPARTSAKAKSRVLARELWEYSEVLADQQTEPANYLSVCCIVKDENDYLPEWLDYHRKIGATHFYIYDNGSRKPVAEAIRALGYDELVTVTHMPGQNMHVKAYQHCLDNFGYNSRWIAFIDMDEFIVPKNESASLPQLLEKYENYGGIGVSWLIFGSNGHIEKPAGSQLENFTRRSDVAFLPNRHIKSIVQPRHVQSAYKSHCFKYKPGFFCVNEHFVPIEEALADVSVDTIQLNHYYCRSLAEYRQKVERGISDTKRKRKLEEFHNHDAESNVVEDRIILGVLAKLNTIQKS